jgi:prepilin-type N-terminal cleavage/methylation domain-containing protein
MIKRLSNKLLKNSKRAQFVMLNWFQHLVELVSCETLNQVQCDKETFFQQPNKFSKSHYEKLRTPNSELQGGFTLIEIIVVIVILSIVSAITIKFLVDSMRIYTMTVNQKTLFDEGKLALERMCRDIRDANTITTPASGGSGNTITFTRTNATGAGQDLAGDTITYRLNSGAIQREKASYALPYPILASNVSSFTVTHGAAGNEEITLLLTLSLGSGETMTLQTKVYPKNFPISSTYKNFKQYWREEPSS